MLKLNENINKEVRKAKKLNEHISVHSKLSKWKKYFKKRATVIKSSSTFSDGRQYNSVTVFLLWFLFFSFVALYLHFILFYFVLFFQLYFPFCYLYLYLYFSFENLSRLMNCDVMDVLMNGINLNEIWNKENGRESDGGRRRMNSLMKPIWTIKY